MLYATTISTYFKTIKCKDRTRRAMKSSIKSIPLNKLHSETINRVCEVKCGACRFKNWFYMRASMPASIDSQLGPDYADFFQNSDKIFELVMKMIKKKMSVEIRKTKLKMGDSGGSSAVQADHEIAEDSDEVGTVHDAKVDIQYVPMVENGKFIKEPSFNFNNNCSDQNGYSHNEPIQNQYHHYPQNGRELKNEHVQNESFQNNYSELNKIGS